MKFDFAFGLKNVFCELVAKLDGNSDDIQSKI